ncbi:hypothetical protein D3C85_1039810 [compost metagenome]
MQADIEDRCNDPADAADAPLAETVFIQRAQSRQHLEVLFGSRDCALGIDSGEFRCIAVVVLAVEHSHVDQAALHGAQQIGFLQA